MGACDLVISHQCCASLGVELADEPEQRFHLLVHQL